MFSVATHRVSLSENARLLDAYALKPRNSADERVTIVVTFATNEALFEVEIVGTVRQLENVVWRLSDVLGSLAR